MQSNISDILQKVKFYSPDMQREILDYIEFLEKKYKLKIPQTKKKSSLRNDPFIGMWKNRKDMNDSVESIRNLRKKESNRNNI